MNRAGLTAALYLFLTFSSGAAVGGFSIWMYNSRTVQAEKAGAPRRLTPEDYRKQYVQELETRCKLSPDQVQKLNTVLDTTREIFRELHDKVRPEYDAIQEHQTAQIRSILSSQQKSEFDKFRQERDQRRSKGNARPPY